MSNTYLVYRGGSRLGQLRTPKADDIISLPPSTRPQYIICRTLTSLAHAVGPSICFNSSTMHWSTLALALGQALGVAALPQGIGANEPEPCVTETVPRLGVDTTVSDFRGLLTSLNSEYSTSGVTFAGPEVPIYTSTLTFGDGFEQPITIRYDSSALSDAGFTVTSGFATSVSCPTVSTTPTLPPSPTGSICSPHDDHCTCPSVIRHDR